MTPREGAVFGGLLGLVGGALAGDLLSAMFIEEGQPRSKQEKITRGTVGLVSIAGTLIGAALGAGGPPNVTVSAVLPPQQTGAGALPGWAQAQMPQLL